MTRNNLKDHLSWLLANIAITAPNAPSLPPVGDSVEELSSDDETSFLTAIDSRPEHCPEEPFESPLCPPIPRNNISAHGSSVSKAISYEVRDSGGAGAGEDMGRLSSSKSSSSKRPGLILRQEQQLLTPTPTTTSRSIQSEYASLLSRNAASARAANRRMSPSRQRPQLPALPSCETAFLTPGATLSSNDDFNVIDLTSDDRQASPSVTYGSDTHLWREDFAVREEPVSTTANSVAFGSDKMLWEAVSASRPAPASTTDNSVVFGSNLLLWGEEFAVRPEPPASTRGKKRKSDQISQPVPTVASVEEFPDIFDLLPDDDTLSSRMNRSPTRSPAKSKLKTRASQSPSKTTTILEIEEVHQVEQRATTSKTLSPVLTRKDRRSPLKPTKKDGSSSGPGPSEKRGEMSSTKRDSIFGDDTISPIDRPMPNTPTTKRHERIIQDSDDELLSPSAHLSPEHMARESPSPKTTSLQVPMETGPSAVYKTPSKRREPNDYQPKAEIRSPKKRDPEELSQKLSASGSRLEPVTPPQKGSQSPDNPRPTISNEEQSALLELFLAQPSVMERVQTALEESMQKNKDAFKVSLERGDFEVRGHLRREKEQLVQQQAALEALSDEYRFYAEISVKRAALITRISDAYAQDLDTEDDETRLSELENILKERQELLKINLLKAGISNRDLLEEEAARLPQTIRRESVVKATQAVPPVALPSWTRETTAVPGVSSTQVIFQTQFPRQSESRQQVIERNHDEIPVHRSARKQRRQNDPAPPPDFEDLAPKTPFQRSRSDFSQTPARQKAARQPSHVTIQDEEDTDHREDIDSTAGRTTVRNSKADHSANAKRRSSAQKTSIGRLQDDHSDYSDDLDMSELAQEFELRQSSTENRQPKSTRAVLAETSGNGGLQRSKSLTTRSPSSSAVSSVSPEQKKYPWYKDVKKALKDRFRMARFRHNQLEAINATLIGKDAFILMPTGGGKSLCYQLPAVITSGKTNGVTVVVSPLISLMQDQVDHLEAINIHACTFNGEATPEARRKILEFLKEPYPENYINLLYVTPEMINKSKQFLNALSTLYRNKKLARLVIDEAHCVSQWGHDFRPDYKEIGSFRERFPRVPLMALTATATHNVIMDVKHNLGIEECEEFSQSFNRPNLYYEVLRKEKDNVITIADLINSKYPEQTGIVYTLSRKSAETIAAKLRDQGIAAHHYHAQIKPDEKSSVQKKWQSGEIKVVVATIAFGMGIDKPDVRFVIHHSIPKSLEGYYQETGRAGRDGKPSDCYLFFNYGDVTQLRKMISDGDGSEEQKERQRNMLSMVTAFCDNQSDCRRVEILRYFGESFSKEQCNKTCDNCRSKDRVEQKDCSEYAIAALETVRAKKKVTLAQCTDFLMGRKHKSDFSPRIEEFYGVAKRLQKHEVHRIIDRLVLEDALWQENVLNKRVGFAFQYYRIGRNAHAFLSRRRQLVLTTRIKGDGSQAGASETLARLVKPAAAATRKARSRASASTNFPSTNVSSPVQARARKNKGKAIAVTDEESEEDDGFVVGDEGYDTDDFETMAPPKITRPRQRGPVGPPISQDPRMHDAPLSDMLKDFHQTFLEDAKTLEERVRSAKNLRQPIFTEAQLREMSLGWTLTLEKMRTIKGINKEKVDRYGDRLLPLIHKYHKDYQEMMGIDPSAEPGPATRVVDTVDLVSPDEDEDEEMDDIDDEDDGEQSIYFAQAAKNQALNKSRARTGASAPPPSNTGDRSGPTFSKRSTARKSSGGASKLRRTSGVHKKAAKSHTSRRAGSGSYSRSTSIARGQARGKGATTSASSKSKPKSGGGLSGIGLMEH